ncbi:MAG: hypothetical protein RIE56_00360, partial [Amphiplicatus sp.]
MRSGLKPLKQALQIFNFFFAALAVRQSSPQFVENVAGALAFEAFGHIDAAACCVAERTAERIDGGAGLSFAAPFARLPLIFQRQRVGAVAQALNDSLHGGVSGAEIAVIERFFRAP